MSRPSSRRSRAASQRSCSATAIAAPYIQELLDYRIRREEAIAEALRDGAVTPRELVDKLYSQTHPWLRQAAERNVTAHLLKLQAEGRAEPSGKGWISAERQGAG